MAGLARLFCRPKTSALFLNSLLKNSVSNRSRRREKADCCGTRSAFSASLPRRLLVQQTAKLVTSIFGLLLVSMLVARGAGIVTNCTSADLSAALVGGGLVTFDCNGTIYLTNTITITNHTTLDASGRAVVISGLDGTNSPTAVRVLNVNSGINLTLLNLTLAKGRSTNAGAIFNNGGRILATNCFFMGNRAIGTDGLAGADGKDHNDIGGDGKHGEAGGNALGGAIYNLGELTLSFCTFQTNSATGGNGGAGGSGGDGNEQGGNGANGGDGGIGYGGAVYSAGTIFAMNCTFAGNAATGGDAGAGGSNGDGRFASFGGGSGHGADAAGAGLYSLGTSTIVSSTFSNNEAQGGDSTTAGEANNGNGLDGRRGGDGFGGGVCNLGVLAMTNCTVVANSVTGGAGGNGGDGTSRFGGDGGDGGNGGDAWGGGLHNSGSAVLNYCTFSNGNAIGGPKGLGGDGVSAGENGSNGAKKGGNISRDGGSLILRNTIIAYSASGNNGAGKIVDGGHNISSDGSLDFSAPSSLKRTDPKLGSLANNGGPTLTVALLTGSPAINAGDNSDCPAFDQRGEPRPFGPGCDIGAYEFEPTFSIQGRILEGTNGVGGITVTAGTYSAISATNGNYLISNLVSNNYTVTPQPVGVGFNPASRTVSLGPNATNIDFVLNQVRITGTVPTTNGPFQLSFLGGPGRTYRIEASTTLTTWQTISTNTAATNGLFQYIDGKASNFPTRFYRTVTP